LNVRLPVIVITHQSTLPRLAASLCSGVTISKRQSQRLLADKQESFAAEDQDVLRAGRALDDVAVAQVSPS
jgi:hypothetical protein